MDTNSLADTVEFCCTHFLDFLKIRLYFNHTFFGHFFPKIWNHAFNSPPRHNLRDSNSAMHHKVGNLNFSRNLNRACSRAKAAALSKKRGHILTKKFEAPAPLICLRTPPTCSAQPHRAFCRNFHLLMGYIIVYKRPLRGRLVVFLSS